MQVTRFDERQQLLEWAAKLKAIAEKRSDQFAASAIQREIDDLISGRFMLVVLGKVKRGKSTLCNAFLGRHDDLIAPVDKLPASSVISKFIHDEKEWVRILYQDGRTEITDYRHVRDFVTEQSNPGNKKEVDCVEVFGPFPGLEKDLVLVDTPGAGSIHKHHDAMLHGFLPQADAVIFLVTARMPIAEDELELLRELKSQDIKKVFFAINQVDTCDEDEIRDGIEHNSKMLSNAGIRVDTIYRISAKLAMQGDVEASGLPVLLSDISGFLAKSKGEVLRSNFLAATTSLARSMGDTVSLEIESASKSQEQLEAELQHANQNKRVILESREITEKRYLFAWKNAVEEFADALPNSERAAAAGVAEKVRGASIFGIGQLRKELPTIIMQEVEKATTPTGIQCEQALKEATEELLRDYPTIEVNSHIQTTFASPRHQMEIPKGIGKAVAGIGTVAAAGYFAGTASAITGTAAAAAAGLSPWIAWIPGVTAAVTGAGTVAAAPAVMIATVLGPVGWVLAGWGGLAVALNYRSQRLKTKDELVDAAKQEVMNAFAVLRRERIQQLHRLGDRLAERYRLKLENDLAQIEIAIGNAIQRKGSTKDLSQLQRLSEDLLVLVKQSKAFAC